MCSSRRMAATSSTSLSPQLEVTRSPRSTASPYRAVIHIFMEKHELEEDQYVIILTTHLWYDGGRVREVAGRQPGGDEGADGQQGDQVVRVPRDLR